MEKEEAEKINILINDSFHIESVNYNSENFEEDKAMIITSEEIEKAMIITSKEIDSVGIAEENIFAIEKITKEEQNNEEILVSDSTVLMTQVMFQKKFFNFLYIPGKSCLKRALGFLRGGANHFFLFFDFQTLKRHSSTTIQSISKKTIVVIIGGLRWPEKNNLADSAISGQNITSIAKNRQFGALSKCPPPSNFCGKIFLIK